MIVRFLGSLAGQRESTVSVRFKYADSIVEWLNLNGYKEVFASEAAAQQAYRDYTAHLNELVAQQKWKSVSAAQAQHQVATLIALLYPENSHHIRAGAVSIRAGRESAAVGSAHLELYRDVCLAIAMQCSDHVLNNKPYPWVVTIRNYEVVVFPSHWG